MKARKLLSLALSITMIMSIFLSSTQAFAEGGEADNNDKTTVADQSVEPENDLQPAEQEQPEPIVAGEQEGGMPACTCTVNCGQDSINGECSLCSADYSKCAFVQSQCICGSLCTAESVNADCPVCSAAGADLSKCAGNSSGAQEPESTPGQVCAQLPECVDGSHGADCPLYVPETEEDNAIKRLSRSLLLRKMSLHRWQRTPACRQTTLWSCPLMPWLLSTAAITECPKAGLSR